MVKTRPDFCPEAVYYGIKPLPYFQLHYVHRVT
jgi:hypothetical protein